MDCETLLTYLSDYIDNNLDEDLTEAAREHLETCHNCHVVLDSTQQAILLYKQHSLQTIPAQRRQKVYRQIEAAFQKKRDSSA